ncbi:MAG TPA: beta-ketoacyl synthase N-terminal-like domain-containing protein [Acidobacteriaceae bacterium]|nr:beta-ketoacyl synthase N-terminal-like domain-containing protein [Acidobacteriaceae bacterium]
MNQHAPSITGIGSVTPFGPLAGLIPPSPLDPTVITGWPTKGPRRAFLVDRFNPASVVPGLKTRRLDRLSAWALVASSLALRDAGIDLQQVDHSRVAVVFATGFGCIDLTASFFQSAFNNTWSGTDPITFPETLANSPAGHIALVNDFRGPNITISSKHFAAESALLQAASLLRHGQADLAIVIAGDTLTQAIYEWYGTARLLSPACYASQPASESSGFIPSEGVVAVVLEPCGKRVPRCYARLHTGRWASAGDPRQSIREILSNAIPSLMIAAGNGAPCSKSSPKWEIAGLVAPRAQILPAQSVALGLTDTGALLHLVLALSKKPDPGHALMLATSGDTGFAALLLELPNSS